MGGLGEVDAEAWAERCVDACNRVLQDGDATDLADLLSPDAVIEISEDRTDLLSGADELAERLLASAHHGGLVVLDAEPDGDDVVAGVAWADTPSIRTAEVRLVPRDDHIARIEWVH